MNRLWSIFFLIILISMACKSKRTPEITTDNINIPITADGISQEQLKKMPVMTFEKIVHDFGKVMQGETVGCVFTFTNTGKSNLIIASADASCGCTVPDYTKTPIKPGEKGEIKVRFNTESKFGEVKNSVTVFANTYPTYTVLSLNAQVVKP